MWRQRASRAGYVLSAVALFACSSSVQDLGRTVQDDPVEMVTAGAAHDGFGAGWACPESPQGRELACPLTRPIDGDACAPRNSAPCSYVGEPASRPDRPDNTGAAATTTFCICTRELQWACLQDVTMRTLDMPLQQDDPCEDALSIEIGSVRCSCEHGRVRCVR